MPNLREILDEECRKHRATLGRMPIPLDVEAVVMKPPGREPIIIIDSSIDDPRKIHELLAHELGHLKCGTGNNFTADPMVAAANEALADRRATEIYLSFTRLLHAVQAGCHEAWEFAEELEITEDGVLDGLRILQSVVGDRVICCEGYVMSFFPELRVVRLDEMDEFPTKPSDLAPYTEWTQDYESSFQDV